MDFLFRPLAEVRLAGIRLEEYCDRVRQMLNGLGFPCIKLHSSEFHMKVTYYASVPEIANFRKKLAADKTPVIIKESERKEALVSDDDEEDMVDKGGGGVILLHQSNLNVEEIKTSQATDLSVFWVLVKDMRVVEGEDGTMNRQTIVGSVKNQDGDRGLVEYMESEVGSLREKFGGDADMEHLEIAIVTDTDT